MLRRTPFKTKAPAARKARQWDGDAMPTARAVVAVPLVDAPVVAVPKGVRAKPGKGAPTADEKRWLDAIVAYRCIACRIDGAAPSALPAPAVHHILRGGRRLGHRFSLPLCDPGHHQGGEARGLVSRHPWKARFEQRYGSEDFLLRKACAELGWEYPGT